MPGFTTPDPLAEMHYNESPYSYCGNNPVNRVDPSGMDYGDDEDTNDDWYYNQDSKTPIWSPLNIDIPGWNHGETVQSSGPDGIITYYPPGLPYCAVLR